MENINNVNGIGLIEPHNACESYQDSILNKEIKKIYENNDTKFSEQPSIKTLFSIPKPLNNFYDNLSEIQNDLVIFGWDENFLQSNDDGYSEQRIEQLQGIVDFFKQYDDVISEDNKIDIEKFRSAFFNDDLLKAKKYIGWSRKGYKAWKSNNCKNCSFKNGKKCNKFNESIEIINISFVIAEIPCIFKKISCEYSAYIIKNVFRPKGEAEKYSINFIERNELNFTSLPQKDLESFFKTEFYDKYSKLGEEIISNLFYISKSGNFAYIMLDSWLDIYYPEISLNERKMVIFRMRTELRSKYKIAKDEIAQIPCGKKNSCKYNVDVIKNTFRPMNELKNKYAINFKVRKEFNFSPISQEAMDEFFQVDYNKHSYLSSDIILELFHYTYYNNQAYIMLETWMEKYYPKYSPAERKMIIFRIRNELKPKYESAKKEITFNYPMYKSNKFWDDRFLSKEKYNLRKWGTKKGFIWRRDENLHLLDWDSYRKISAEEALFLEVLPQEEQMKLSQFVAMKLEDSNRDNLGVAPILYCKFEGAFYERKGMFWKKIEENGRLMEVVSDQFAELFNGKGSDIAMTRSIIHHYKNRHMIKEDEAFNEISKMKGKIPLINGVLLLDKDFKVSGFRKYSPRDFFTDKINSVYNPEAKAPNIKKFIWEILDHHKGDVDTQKWVDRLLGFTADLLLVGNQMEWILYLLGDGRNGKGTYVELINRLLGKDLISQITWDGFDMANDKFAITHIINKWANICTESNAGKVKSSIVKNISGNDPISIRNLNSSPISYKPLAKLIFVDNMAVNIPKNETAIWRRIVTVTFPNKFLGKNQDNNLKNDDGLLAQEVASGGFLNLLLDYMPLGVRQTIKTEALTNSKDLFQNFREQNFDIYKFLDDAVIITKEESDYIYSEMILELFKAWICLERDPFPQEFDKSETKTAIGTKIAWWIKRKRKDGDFERDHIPKSKKSGDKRVKTNLKIDNIFLAELRCKIIGKLIKDPENFKYFSDVLKNEFIPIKIRDKIKEMIPEADIYEKERIKYFGINFSDDNIIKVEQIWEKKGEYCKITKSILADVVIETEEIKDNKEKVFAQLNDLHKLHGNEEFFPIEDILIPINLYYPKFKAELLTIILKWYVQNEKIEENNKNEYRLINSKSPKDIQHLKDAEKLCLKLS